MRKIQVKRGREATIPTLAQGELGWTTDEKQLYVGTDTANIPVAMGDHTHTAAQVGADAAGAAQAVQDSLNAHAANKNNPHGVTAAQVGARKEVPAVTVTLPAAGWASGRQTVAVSGLGAAQDGFAQIAQTATDAQRTAARNAVLSITGQAANQLTISADGEIPTVDIPITVVLL